MRILGLLLISSVFALLEVVFVGYGVDDWQYWVFIFPIGMAIGWFWNDIWERAVR